MSSTFRVPTWALLAGAMLLAIIYSESVAAAPDFDADGWHTWRVQSVDNSVRCCGIWTSGKLTSAGCHLDNGRSARGCGEVVASDEVQIYVKSTAGRVVEIRALSPQCPVDSEHDIHDLGAVDNAESVAWLSPYMRANSELGEDAIAAIAVHAGGESFAVLRETARSDDDAETRGQALFWMAVTARSGSESEIARAIANDPSYEVREEAVFAMSLLPDERGLTGLIAVLENRSYEMHVREQALFWLAQSDTDDAFDYLESLLSSRR